MIQKPLVSVIITTYNRDRLLPRAINSVLNQTYQNFELIIVNGGSSDDTEKVVKSFKDKRIRYGKQTKNKGMLADRNMGFDLLKGKYIALLDDDDELLPEALETAVNEFSKLSSDGVGMLWFNCMESKNREFTGKGVQTSGYISYEDDLCGKVYGNFWEIIDSDLMDEDARFDERLWGGESIFWFKLHSRTKVFYVHRALRINHTECSTVSTAENQLKHIPRIVLTQKVFLKNYGNLRRHLCPKKYGRDLATLGFWQILNGEKLEGRKTLVNAFKYSHTLSYVLLLLSFAFNQNQIISLYPLLLKIRGGIP
jgi:glycosyltransferase involved in cell wall biosynthesis